jgi:hypothetical protein
MNFEIQKPNHLISLASSAQLVTVEVNVWTATKQDKQISNEVTSSKNASTEAGKGFSVAPTTGRVRFDCYQHSASRNL